MGICSSRTTTLARECKSNFEPRVAFIIEELKQNPPPPQEATKASNWYYDNKSAIGWACYYGNSSMLKKLLTLGYIDPTWCDLKTGASPLDDLADFWNFHLNDGDIEQNKSSFEAYKAVECVKMLLKHDPSKFNDKLINRVNPETGLTPLQAISNVKTYHKYAHEFAIELLANGADVNARAAKNITALMLASTVGNQYIVGEILSNLSTSDKAVEILNAQDSDGHTALSRAAFNGNVECFLLLLGAQGIDVNLPVKRDINNFHPRDGGDVYEFTTLAFCIFNFSDKPQSSRRTTNEVMDMRLMLKNLLAQKKDSLSLYIRQAGSQAMMAGWSERPAKWVSVTRQSLENGNWANGWNVVATQSSLPIKGFVGEITAASDLEELIKLLKDAETNVKDQQQEVVRDDLL